MSLQCQLSGKVLQEPIFESQGESSITSLGEVLPVRTQVYFNPEIAHLQTRELSQIEAYYESDYNILTSSEEEDQLYTVREDDSQCFRSEHQASTFLSKAKLAEGARLLDYGCGKALTQKRVQEQRPDLQLYAFEVSDNYRPFWERFLPAENQASHEIPEHWHHSFDAIASYFVFEHVVEPIAIMRQMHQALRPGGLVYLVIPNVYANPADLVVVDHTHHYSEESLRVLLAEGGFENVEIDTDSHRAAFIASGCKSEKPQHYTPDPTKLEQLAQAAQENSMFWKSVQSRIQDFENEQAERSAAIYGAGFYGSYIYTSLLHKEHLHAFLDRDPWLKGQKKFDVQVYVPEELPETVEVVYVALNPAIAKEAIAGIEAWKDRSLSYFYL